MLPSIYGRALAHNLKAKPIDQMSEEGKNGAERRGGAGVEFNHQDTKKWTRLRCVAAVLIDTDTTSECGPTQEERGKDER